MESTQKEILYKDVRELIILGWEKEKYTEEKEMGIRQKMLSSSQVITQNVRVGSPFYLTRMISSGRTFGNL